MTTEPTDFESLEAAVRHAAAHAAPREASYLTEGIDPPVPEQFDHTGCGVFDFLLSPSRAQGISFITERPKRHKLQPASYELQRAVLHLLHEVCLGMTDKGRLLAVLQTASEPWGLALFDCLSKALSCWGARLDDMIDPDTGRVDSKRYEAMCAAIADQPETKVPASTASPDALLHRKRSTKR